MAGGAAKTIDLIYSNLVVEENEVVEFCTLLSDLLNSRHFAWTSDA